jgi:(1->4)-alpha-D-glucan 1-alpha-D-glucosylmutase
MDTPHRTPLATYRFQLRAEAPLATARQALPYLRLLGISDLYLSPIYQARPGSIHGYDVVDHARINPELGDAATLGGLMDDAQAEGMGVLLDVVPNHMCISTDANTAWWDVLEDGPESPRAAQFDVDWDPPKPELVDKVLLPFLGDQYGRVLEEALAIEYRDGSFHACWNDQRLPIRPDTWPHLLGPALEALRAELPPEDAALIELESILRALAQALPGLRTAEPEGAVAYRHEKAAIRQRLQALSEGVPAVAAAIARSVAAINGTRGDPASFDNLERLMDEQCYRLAHWRVAAHEINYRRFFDVNDLAALRVEDPAVFAEVHALPFSVAGHPALTGFRIDHVDGLWDPQQYLIDLDAGWKAARAPAGNGDGGPAGSRPFVVVEKILGPEESLCASWLADGTTGYDFIATAADALVWQPGAAGLEAAAAQFVGPSPPFETTVAASKRLVLQTTLAAELTVLARRLDRISEQHRYTRDFTLNHLQEALGEIVAAFPVYRSYLRRDESTVPEGDAAVLRRAVAAARRNNPLMNASLFDFIASVLLRDDPPGLTPAQLDERRTFTARFQQLTGPVMAKGVEDTAFYRHLPLLALNEVGGDPRRVGASTGAIHERLRARREAAPRTMSATATHDTKRGEDTRARLYVLSEVAETWAAATTLWSTLTANHKTVVDGAPVPAPSEEYLFYQTLVGAWPVGGQDHGPAFLESGFPERIRAYMSKARHEAKQNTSWINPNVAYDKAADEFVAAALDPERSRGFLRDVDGFVRTIVKPGLWNSLSQVILKISSPGIPDFFQGTELWDFSLVDPDNRRLVDFEARRRRLTELLAAFQERGAEAVASWFESPDDGAIKLWLTAAALRTRRTHRAVFDRGAYVPLEVRGPSAEHALAFARVEGDAAVVTVVGRFFSRLRGPRPTGAAWGENQLVLPPALGGRPWRDTLTGQPVPTASRDGRLDLAAVFQTLPVALLEVAS